MGRASSAKKIQRVAKASGRTSTKSRGQRNLAFPAVVTLVVVLGIALVGYGVLQEEEAAGAGPALGDHWHSAIGVYVCDAFVDAPTDQNGDANGIHTHGDNVIHIHPSTSAAAEENATLGVFAEEVGIELGDGEFTLANGDTYANGDDCNGEPGKVRVVAWDSAADTSAGRTVYEDDFADVPFKQDGMAFTIAFVPEDSDILPPPTASQLPELGAVDGGSTSGDGTVPGDPTATVPIDPAATVPEGAEDPTASSTTAPAAQTTTTAAPGG
jgi:hypothetical protein